jgi:cytochrome c-type biogenesis protein CcmE
MQMRYGIGALIILAAMMVVSMTTYSQFQEAYYSVDQLLADSALYSSEMRGQAEALAMIEPDSETGTAVGNRLQLRGSIAGGSVLRAQEGLGLSFGLAGKEGSVPVIYEGIVPDTFEMAETVTVGGKLSDRGVFLADELFVQCPSKYEAVPPGEEASSAEASLDG